MHQKIKSILTKMDFTQYQLKGMYFILLTLFKKQVELKFVDIPMQLDFNFSLAHAISKHKTTEPLLIFHSLNGCGNKDKRILQLAMSASQIGFDVYLPHFMDTANRIVHKNSLNRIREFLKQFHDYLQTPFSIMAPCYDGSLCLEALSDEAIKPLVKSICCIGSSHSFDKVVENTLHKKEFDPFNLVVILKTLLNEIDELTPNINDVLTTLFMRLDENQTLSTSDKQCLSSDERFWIDNALNQALIREQYKTQCQEKFHWNLHQRLHLITTPVSLIHGSHDHVVPVENAFELNRGLIASPHRLVVTNLLGHGNIQLTKTLIKDVIDLINAFGFFFKHACEGTPKFYT